MKLKDFKPFKVQVTEEQSRDLQEKSFNKGFRWAKSGKSISELDRPFLFFKDNSEITYATSQNQFISGHIISNDRLLHFHDAIEYLNKFEDYKECTGYVRCIKGCRAGFFIKNNCYKLANEKDLSDTSAVINEKGNPDGFCPRNTEHFEYITKSEYDAWKDSQDVVKPEPPYILKSLAEALGVDVSIFVAVKAEKVGWQTGWDNIPNEYEYRTMNKDGKCHVHEGSKPFIRTGYTFWVNDNLPTKIGKSLYIGDWKNSLQKRPNKK